MKFNAAQSDAIRILDKNVSVSAGAGSGKTRVLVERFCRLIRDGGVRADEILTVTFTEKAAKEMKQRIVARFAQWHEETGEERFREAARSVEIAYIGTIHSFATRILRENAFEAGIDPRFKVLTEIEAELLKERVLDTTAAAGFAGGRPEYIDLLLGYGGRAAMRAVKGLHAELASLARADARAAIVPAGEMAEAAGAYFDAAAAIRGYDGKVTDKLAARLDDFNDRYPAVQEAMLATVADFKRLGTAEFSRTFDWDRLDLIAGIAKPVPGNIGGREFQSEIVKPAVEAHQRFIANLLAPLSAHYSDCLIRVTADFGREYAAVKHRTGQLDFDDLLLRARELLVGPDGKPTATAVEYRRKFKHVMIDEFQDTNALQKGIIESVCPARRLFTVGDVKQSIFSFMHSDVSVFQGHQLAVGAGAGKLVSMRENYRSRPEVIDFVNGFFAELWTEDEEFEFEPLRAEGEFFPGERREVELVWVEAEAGGTGPAGDLSAADRQRAAEARAIAGRIRELLGREGAEPLTVTKKEKEPEAPRPLHPGDILILFRSTGNIKVYERALAEAGLDYYVVSGRGFYASREVGDMLNLLRVVDNPLDDVAMAAVLRSPLAAVNEDTLWWLSRREGAGQVETSKVPGKLYLALERADEIEAIDSGEKERLIGWRETLRELHSIRSESRLSRLIDLAVARTAYDLKLLASSRGKRRYANLRKLSEAAREFGAASVFQLPDFIRHIERMTVVAQREGEAPTESEESRVIRLMTVHGAKGLQAPVVFVADCSRKLKVGAGKSPFIFDKALGVAAKVRSPLINDWVAPRQFAIAAERAKIRDIEEEKRLFYVAATRAEELLVLSGAAAWNGKASEKNSYRGLPSWMGWVEKALEADEPPGLDEILISGSGVPMRCIKGAAAPPAAAGRALPADYLATILAGSPLAATEGPGPDVAAMIAPYLAVTKRPVDLTVSGMADYLSCPRKYELRRRLGVSEPASLDVPPAIDGEPAADAAHLGTIVHEVMAALDWTGDIEDQMTDLIASVDEPAREDARDRCARFLTSPWAARIKAGTAWFQEAPFRLELENCRLYGRIDLLFREPDGWVVVDYKTGAGGDTESYNHQVRLYGLAVKKALGEAPAEVALVGLGGGGDFAEKVDRAMMAEAEALLAQAAERIGHHDFTAVNGERCYQCGYARRFCRARPKEEKMG